MFNNTPTLSATPAKSNSTSVITKNSTIKGDINSDENIRLDGCIIGKIYCKQRLVIGSEGRLEGSVQTEHADISGTVYGDIAVFGHLNIQSTAKIFGNIQAKYIQVGEGAIMEGECRVGKVTTKRKEKSTADERIDLLQSEPIAPIAKGQVVKPKIKQRKEKLASFVNEIRPTKPAINTETKKIVKPVPAMVAQVKETVTTSRHFFPEGEFNTPLEEQKTAPDSTIKKDTIKKEIPKRKAYVHYTASPRVSTKTPTRQFNAAKFTNKEEAKIEQKTNTSNEAKGERKYGIKLPSIIMKWSF